MEVYQSGDAVDRRGRLIEADMSSPSDSEDLQVDASIELNLLLVVLAELYDRFPRDLAVGDVDVLSRDIDVVEQVQIHVVVVGLGVVALDRIVLVQIEGHYVLETELASLVHLHQLAVNCNWCAPRGQSQHEGLSSGILPDDLLLDEVSHCE